MKYWQEACVVLLLVALAWCWAKEQPAPPVTQGEIQNLEPMVDVFTPPEVIPEPYEIDPLPPSDVYSNEHDDIIFFASEKYLPGWPPAVLKALLYQESTLKTDAVGRDGEEGMAQIMPSTKPDIVRCLGYDGDSFDPVWAIPGAACYLASHWKRWEGPRSDVDRVKLSVASYNAGYVGIRRAQKRCGNRPGYDEIAPCSPSSTQDYVRRIEKHYYRQIGEEKP